jgi:hypothetical protein
MMVSREGAKAPRFGSRRGAEDAEKMLSRATARPQIAVAGDEGLLPQPNETPLRLCANPLLPNFASSRLRVNLFFFTPQSAPQLQAAS